MNLVLMEREELAGDGTIRLQDRRAHHLLKVLEAQPGRTVRAGVLGEGRASAEVLAVQPPAIVLRLLEPVEIESQPVPLRLVLALPRPKALRRIIQSASCLGATRIDLVNAWRVSSSYFSSPALSSENLRHEATLGAEQGARCHIPKIEVHRLLMPFLDTLQPVSGERRLIAHPAAQDLLPDLEANMADLPVTLAIGPEGGWIDREINSLTERAFSAFRLGDSILRSEVAVVAALTQIDLLRQRQLTKPSNL